MTRSLGPRPSLAPGGTGACWAVLIGCWGLVALNGIVWAAARIASRLSGGAAEPFGIKFASDVLHGRTGRAWPHTPTPLVAATSVLLLALAAALAIAAGLAVARRRPAPADPVAALARNPAMAALTRRPVARSAIQHRPSLVGTDPRTLNPGDAGLALGRLMRPGRRGPTVYAGWEDTIVAFMAPRTGKTSAQAIPFVLSAPGAVIATSNKADLWAATAAIRAARGGGAVWLFDPQRITHQPQTWWWNPLHGLRTVEEAHRLAGHFVLTVADEHRRDLWGPAAQDLLAALFLAAAPSGHTLHDVAGWLSEPAVPTPIELLAAAGFTAMATSLRGAQNGAVETRDSIYQTARTAAKAMTDPEIMAWVTPPRRGALTVFDPDGFAASRDTLYLLSKSRSAAAPLIAALSDTAMRAAERRAERLGGRLDPPLVVPLDEAANICRIADLPDLYSHLGSRGIVPVAILQSYEQGVTVWGEHGMAALWGAATKKIIGAGVDSPPAGARPGHPHRPARCPHPHYQLRRGARQRTSLAAPSGHPRTRRDPRPAAPDGAAACHRDQTGAHPPHPLVRGPARRRDRGRSACRPGRDPRPRQPRRLAAGGAAGRIRHRRRTGDNTMTTDSTTDDLADAAPPVPGFPSPVAPAGSPDNASRQADGHVVTGVPRPEFDRLEDWLTEYFLPMFRRTLGGEYRWCAQWWRHGEAISRLNALWHSWEVLRTQPGTGIATWYREHLDHQLPLLLGARGPFYQCSEDAHREPHQAAADPAPDGWWDPAEPEPAEEPGDSGPADGPDAGLGGHHGGNMGESVVAGHGNA
jgi:Domain of unknown function (DUF4913)/TraM recognition site of TraD and TraG